MVEMNKEQLEAIEFYEGACNVIAAAGSGKSTVIINRVAKLINEHGVQPYNILVVTFGKGAIESLRERLTRIVPDCVEDINIETFHSLCWKIIRKFDAHRYDVIQADWEKVKVIEEAMKQNGIFQPSGWEVSEMARYISVQKNHLVQPDTGTKEGRIYEAYDRINARNRKVDFDDMLVKCYELLSSYKPALDHFRSLYRFILADEMQDTNTAQYEILKLIGAGTGNVFVVDDPLQNIYEWRGSDNKYVMEFDQDWSGAKTINMNTNYRSTYNIVEFANKFASYLPESNHKHYVPSVSARGIGTVPTHRRYAAVGNETGGVASEVDKLIKSGYAARDIAIIARTNAGLQPFEVALRTIGIPCSTVGGMSFAERKETKTVTAYLRLMKDHGDNEAFEYIFNKPNRYLGKVFLESVKKVAAKRRVPYYEAAIFVAESQPRYTKGVRSLCSVIEKYDKNDSVRVSTVIKRLRNSLSLDSFFSKDLCGDDDDSCENLDYIYSISKQFKTVAAFIDHVNTMAKGDKKNGVNLMTAHKAKGLEFPIVFVVSVNSGVFPHKKSKNIGEEMRLMYVAITRAEDVLYITSSDGRKASDNESEFIPMLFRKGAKRCASKQGRN